ncbi:hypothetical protein CA54_02870 [Symmachiella macrocystis]|uniref:Uncharacterized protein n=1 Tax=Symmachiella macrocystis TaxID=2527985 RepID=A0A5C6BHM8_9PLAN|nr:hypothetical protein [Symmachiella macrocystis]TWU11480.1 hypothetical protein CA54_02870 [Symmachiella macrocystis]
MTDASAKKPPERRTNYRQLFSFAVCCGLICWIIEYPIQPVFAAANQNTLLIGKQALSQDSYMIPIAPVSSFGGMTVEEILRLRVKAVWQQPLLIGINYRPSEAVFCRLRSRSAWRELPGESQSVSDAEPELSAGSEYVLNPYLLVAAKLAPPPVEPNVDASAGQLFPISLSWESNQCRATAVYDVSRDLRHSERLDVEPVSLDEISLQLVGMNARDMNLNYAAILPNEANGVWLPQKLSEAVLIEQYLRHDPHCGAPGGCNEVSPPQKEFTGLRLTDLPARMTIRLWRDRPESPDAAPEMRFVLEFR